jgi:hypothetical protein
VVENGVCEPSLVDEQHPLECSITRKLVSTKRNTQLQGCDVREPACSCTNRPTTAEHLDVHVAVRKLATPPIASHLTSALSMPMPKAIVATTISSPPSHQSRCTCRRFWPSLPAWYCKHPSQRRAEHCKFTGAYFLNVVAHREAC